MRKHFAAFKKIWDAFVVVAREVIRVGGTIAFQWPRNCSYWHWPRVKKFHDEFDLVIAEFDGCAFGLKSDNGKPIKEPWRIATNMPTLFVAVNARVCDGLHEHDPCAGSNTRKTEQRHT